MEKTGGFFLFLKEMFSNWISGLSGGLSVVLTVATLVFPQFFAGNQGLLHSQSLYWAASAVAFMFASFSTWRREHQARIALEGNSNRPQLLVTVKDPQAGTPYQGKAMYFALHHLGGDSAKFIQVQPLISRVNAARKITFDQVDFLDGSRNNAPLSVKPNFLGPQQPHNWVTITRGFFQGEKGNSLEIIYPLGIKFLWNGKTETDRQDLVWNLREQAFTIRPVTQSVSE